MIVVRPIKRKDLDVFAEFSFESLLGITNLSRDRDKLYEKTVRIEQYFQQDINEPGSEEYFFVLEDLSTARIGGVCGILANSSLSHEYIFRLETIQTNTKHISAPKEVRILKPALYQTNASEVCSLYLQPTFRHSGQGRLLSLSRFLFIAGHRRRFRSKILAEIRGFIDHKQSSPFWEGIGNHFCTLSFVEVMALLDQDRLFVSEIMPKYPIYVDLLPKDVQECIGKTHESSKPAIHMLNQEGFSLTNEIDVIDGGPTLIAQTSGIRTIKNSSVASTEFTANDLNEEVEYIISNERLDFRACFGKLQMLTKQKALINQDVAEALMIKPGDPIRFVSIH